MLGVGLVGILTVMISSSLYWARQRGRGGKPNVLIAGAVGQASALPAVVILGYLLHLPIPEFFTYLSVKDLVLVASLTSVTSYISVMLIARFMGEDYLMKFSSREIQSLNWVKRSLILLVLAPVTEELLFRGFIQYSLTELMNPLISLTVTSFAFTFVHVGAVKPKGLPIVLALGLLLGLPVYLGTGIYGSIVTHSIINLQGIRNAVKEERWADQ